MNESKAQFAVSEEDVAQSWIKRQYLAKKDRYSEDQFWAHEALDDICTRNPVECLRVIQRILAIDPSDFIAANVAAGPLEDLLGRHGLEVINTIEVAAREDPALRTTLTGVWRNAIDQSVWERIKAIND